ncbi:MAG: hypothetical protein O2797_05205 [Bacteroidetes bacterium]|nr:hypothetical protein [Bacteroidota bacterium]
MFGEHNMLAQRFTPLLHDLWLKKAYEVFPTENILALDFADVTVALEKVLDRAGSLMAFQSEMRSYPIELSGLNQHASKKVFRLKDDSREAIADRLREDNNNLLKLTGADLNQHMSA